MNKFPKKYMFLLMCKISLSMLFILFVFAFGASTPDDDGEILIKLSSASILIYILVAILIIGLAIVYSLLYYKNHNYSFNEDNITFYRGVIFRRKIILPYSKINNIKTKKNIIDMLFGLEYLKIDNGTVFSGDMSEIILVDTPENISEFEKFLKEKVNINEIEIVDKIEENEYKFSLGKMLGYSYIRYGILISLLLFVVMNFIISTSDGMPSKEEIFIPIITFAILCFAIIPLILLVACFITFFKFKVNRKEDSIIVSYGLIEKKKNVIDINRIRAIKITQSLMQRLLKTYSISVEVVGFGSSDQSKNKDILLPYLKQKELQIYLDKYFGDWNLNEDEKYLPPKNSYKCFISIPLFIANLFVLPIGYAIFVTAKFYMGILILFVVANIFLLIMSIFMKNTQKLVLNDDNIILTNGIFSKKTTIISKKDIVIVRKCTTPYRQKRGICNYVIGYYNTITDSIESVNIVSDKLNSDKFFKNK